MSDPSYVEPTEREARNLLDRCSLFVGIDPDVLDVVVGSLKWSTVPGGEVLVGPEREPGGAWLVLHGRFRVTHRSDTVHFEQRAGVGETIGAVALLSDVAARFTAVALQDSEVAFLSREVFREMACCDPALWLRLSAQIGGEVGGLLRAPPERRRARQVAIFPVDPRAPLDEFVGDLQRALQTQRRVGGLADEKLRVKVLDRETFEREIGRADDEIAVWNKADREILSRIEALSNDFEVILFQADLKWNDWTRRCIGQAESVLVVTRSNAERSVDIQEEGEFLRHASTAQADSRLVLLHPRRRAPGSLSVADPENTYDPDGVRDPTGTAEWLDRRPSLHRVHHVRLGRHGHYERLARHLTGTAVGLVLGGGGARGQAHLGVIEALRDCGAHIDAVGGTSAGGGIAAITTYEPKREMTEDEFDRADWYLQEQVRAKEFEVTRAAVWRAFVELAPFAAISLPFHSLMRKTEVEAPSKFLSNERWDARERASGTLRAEGERWIEDLWLPFFCVSCDIRERKRLVHRRGKLWKALCATTALPGVLPPVVMRGRLLVDGGVVDNIPIGPMRETTSGPLIVVDVGAPQDDLISKQVLDLPVNADVILSHVHPLLDPITVPNLLTVVMSTMDLADKVHRTGHHEPTSLSIRPPIGSYGMTEFKAQRELIAIGYNATIEALRARTVTDDVLASLGTTRERVDRLKPMDERRGEQVKRASDLRVVRALARGAGVLVLGLAIAGALTSSTVALIALIAALIVPLVEILSPVVAWVAAELGDR